MVKNGQFFIFCFLGNIGQENVFYEILERKITFLGYKNKKFKTSKNRIILKGLIHGFWTKMSFFWTSKNCPYSKGVNPWFLYKNGHFSNFFFLGNIGQEKVFVFDILERKNAFLGYKETSSKSRKIAIFPKGLTHGFGPKMAIFPTSFF